MQKPIKVVDLFAGPGGLGEGFSSYKNEIGENRFKIVLSIEKEAEAHKTLLLRSFFRQFSEGNVPDAYYDYIRNYPSFAIEDLFKLFPKQASNAKSEAWQVELGNIPNEFVDKRIKEAIKKETKWVLIGGPPCQAYSLVGRSRRQQISLDPTIDDRVFLYKQYLRILAIHKPPIFIMENVKGLLSAEVEKNPLFQRILDDLSNPIKAIQNNPESPNSSKSEYKIYSLSIEPSSWNDGGSPIFKHGDFVIKSEDFGIPQTRHRVILLGIRNDINKKPSVLQKKKKVSVKEIIGDLPKIRSGLSKIEDCWDNWANVIKNMPLQGDIQKNKYILDKISSVIQDPINFKKGRGNNYIPAQNKNLIYHNWFSDARLGGILNHQSRGHMVDDIYRYLFSACYASVYQKSPKLSEFPKKLLPKHLNIKRGVDENHFGDRFRVQISDEPAKTITSHISKDGHYYIHYDPFQCRSLTVREAARIQTFPDNYFFCGNRTSQYVQVGNAVPPMLALQIAQIINKLFI